MALKCLIKLEYRDAEAISLYSDIVSCPFPTPSRQLTRKRTVVQIMDQLLSGLVIRYLVIAVALLHASRGARPRLRVIYGLMEMENENTLECIDGVSNLIQPGATYTFRNPVTGEIEREYTVGEEERSYSFTIQSTNESLVSCTVSSEESDRVMVAGMKIITSHNH